VFLGFWVSLITIGLCFGWNLWNLGGVVGRFGLGAGIILVVGVINGKVCLLSGYVIFFGVGLGVGIFPIIDGVGVPIFCADL